MKNVRIGGLTVGNDQPLALIAGPCQLETLDHALMIAETLAAACAKAGTQFVFKASYDKANRTSLSGRRGVGMDEGLRMLEEVRARIGCPVLTDIHDIEQNLEIFMGTCQRCGRCFKDAGPLDQLMMKGYRFDDPKTDRWIYESTSYMDKEKVVSDVEIELD